MATKIKLNQLAQSGATDGQVATWDNTLQTWKAATSSGGGSSSGIAGAIQFSGGSGVFSSDATNFFFDDTANQLQLNGGTSYGILINGQNGGVHVSPSSSITGALNGFRAAADATGSINIAVTNSNTSSSSAAARVVLTTSAGGGDPYMLFNTAEVGYSIGVDNDGGDKFYIGVGTSPSGMSTANITLDATKMGVMQTTPTAKLHISGGTATANTAPLKIDSGTALTTTEDGAFEYHSSHLYFTIGSTRYQLDQQTTTSLPLSSITAATTSNTINNVANAQTWNWNSLTTGSAFTLGSTTITSGTMLYINTTNSSLNSSSGLVYINNAGSSTNGTIFRVDSNGNVSGSGLTVRASGNIGIGTNTPAALLHLGGTPEVANGGLNGMFLRVDPSGLTDNSTAASGNVTHTAVTAFNVPQLFAANTAVGYTNASTVYIAGAPTNGTNVTIGNPYAFWIESGAIKLGSANTGVAILTSGVLSTKTNPSGAFVGDTDTQTLTNKRIDPRVTSTTSSSTPTPNVANEDIYILTALAANATFGVPTGTPVQGTKLLVRIKDNGTSRTLAWNAIYRAIGVTLPTATTISKTLYVGFVYNSTDTRWDCIAVTQEA